jgi:hypothetical protein
VARSREGGNTLLPSLVSISPLSDPDPERAHTRSEKRAKSPYSDLFEAVWKLYGRKEEKGKAFAAWRIAAAKEGGEDALALKVTNALMWQGPIWEQEGWRYALYFERYIKRERWNDERPRQQTAPPKTSERLGTILDWHNEREATHG